MIESKHVAHVSIVVDIAISCCVRLLHLVPILLAEVPDNMCVKVAIMSIVSPVILWKVTIFGVDDEAKIFSCI